MPSASYIDIAALDAIRTRFAAAEAMAVFTPALDRVIWANGAGAALFGYSDVAAIIGAESQIGLAARRQIMATSGYPKIGKDRAITVRLASGLMSRAVAFAASEVARPDGAQAILLAHAATAASWRSPTEAAARAIAGLDLPGQHIAIVDAEGGLTAASRDFAGLELKPETLRSLAAETRGERLARHAIETSYGACMAGMLRLTDEAQSHFLLVIDDEALPENTESSPAQLAGDAAAPAAIAEATASEAPAAEVEPGEARAIDSESDASMAVVERQPSSEVQGASAEVVEQPELPAAEEPAEPAAPELAVAAGEVPERAEHTPELAAEQHQPAESATAELLLSETGPAPADERNEQPAVVAAEDTHAAETGDVLAAGAESVPEPAKPAFAETRADADAGDIEPRDDEGVEIEDSELAAVGEAERETAEMAATVADTETSVAASAEVEPGPAAGSAEASDTAAADDAIREPAAAALPQIAVDRSAAPVTFVWKTDAAGRFSEIGEDFVKTIGKPAAEVIGMTFRDAAARLGIDPAGEIAGLLERHDTWSGRAVSWPVAGTDLRIPVDLAALPTYDRDRNFAGFRGFGVARAGDAVVDPDATGLKLVEGHAADAQAAAAAGTLEAESVASDAGAQHAADPFRGEPPILTIVPKPERRHADKVIRLAEHRQPAIDKNLSPGERNAFREIGDRLKKEGGAASARGASEPTRRADNDAARPEGPAARDDHARDGESEEPRPAGLVEAQQELPAAEVTSAAAGAGAEAAPVATEIQPVEQSTAPDAVDTQEEAAQAASGRIEPATDAQVAAEATTADAPLIAEQHEGAGPGSAEPVTEAEDLHETAEPEIVPDAGAEEVQPAAAVVEPATNVADPSPAAVEIEVSAGAHDRPEPAWPAVRDYVPSAFALGSAAGRREPIDTSILDKLPVPVLIHSGDVLHYANREFLELTGYDDVEELQMAGGLDALFGDPYPADDDDEAEPGRKLRLRTNEGLEYPVEAFLQSVPWGEGKSLLLSLRRSWRQPVSYPAQTPLPSAAEDAERESRIEEMRAIVDTATDGVVLIAPDGTIRSISSPAEALFGFDSDEVAGKPFSSLFAIESQRAARDYLNGLSENGVASVLNDGREVIGREAQGRFIPLFMTIGKLPNDSGFCAVVRDITQWKRAEEELTQARAQAERASSQKTDFLARVSHEIRTPLNAIIGFSELMLDEKFGPIGNDRYRDYLRDINRSGNHVLDLVNDLLDISKIEAGQQEMSYEAVSLNDTLGETVAMMQPSANRERVIIRSSFASRLPEVVADLRSIRQIALNLLSNAIRYTPAGGQVIVSTAYEASGDVVMRVRDTGIGMTQAEIEQALKPFKQINALKRARGDGTGLGLPLTKAMVEANRARFMINSTPGEGTLVEISFPSTRVLAD